MNVFICVIYKIYIALVSVRFFLWLEVRWYKIYFLNLVVKVGELFFF